jgi:hypothetical protein
MDYCPPGDVRPPQRPRRVSRGDQPQVRQRRRRYDRGQLVSDCDAQPGLGVWVNQDRKVTLGGVSIGQFVELVLGEFSREEVGDPLVGRAPDPAPASNDCGHHVDVAWVVAAFDAVHGLDAECFKPIPPRIAVVRQRRRAGMAPLFHLCQKSDQAGRSAESPHIGLWGDVDEPCEPRAGSRELGQVTLCRGDDAQPGSVSLAGDLYRRGAAVWKVGLIFWLSRPGLTAEEIAGRTAPYWQRLHGELRLAAVDPLYWLMDASRVNFDDDTPPIGKIMRTFPDEVRPIVEWSLEQWDSLTLTSIFRFAVHDRQDYLISMLATIGNLHSVELLRAYVDDPNLGSSAIRAIKQLTGERP